MVLSYSLKYLSRCYSEDILYMWLKSIISWHQVKEIILDNLGEPGPLSCKASRTELNFPKGKEIPLWATASACGESSCAESSSLPFLTIAHLMVLHFSSSPSVQFSSQSCPTLCNPMDCSLPGFPVHHHSPKLAQTHIHQVSDAIQTSHPLSSLLLLPSIFPSIRVFSNESVLRMSQFTLTLCKLIPCNNSPNRSLQKILLLWFQHHHTKIPHDSPWWVYEQ